MSTSVNVNEALSPDRTIGLGEDWTRAATRFLIAVGVALFVVGTIYVNSPVGPADPSDPGAMVVPSL
jgi:hypothetical protein